MKTLNTIVKQRVCYTYMGKKELEQDIIEELTSDFAGDGVSWSFEQTLKYRKEFCERNNVDEKDYPIYQLTACIEKLEEVQKVWTKRR